MGPLNDSRQRQRDDAIRGEDERAKGVNCAA
jgi:hypothetical protein